MTIAPLKIAFTCGGTGGHVYPAIALAQEWVAMGHEVVFLTSDSRIDAEGVRRYGFPLETVSVDRKTGFGLFNSFWQAYRYFKTHTLSAVVATGGYATLPVGLAAWMAGIPLYVQEQNSVPGRVNRLLARVARRVFLTFPESGRFFPASKIQVVGNPIRRTFLKGEVEAVFEGLDLAPCPTVLVFGGSQGSAALNAVMAEQYDEFVEAPYCLIHLTGGALPDPHPRWTVVTPQLVAAADAQGRIKVVVMSYFEAMDLLYAKADVVMSRAGATTLAELLAFHQKAILVPYPYAMDDHQRHNAEAFCLTGNGTVLPEQDMNEAVVWDLFQRWASAPYRPATLPNQARVQITQQLLTDLGGLS
ncbi:MAG: glycosyltransferase [Candidatus Margulisiibacteriota bacterium]